MPKINEPNKKAPDIAFSQKLSLFDGVAENSLALKHSTTSPTKQAQFLAAITRDESDPGFPFCAGEE
jgi:hypothetical protein